MGLFVGADNGDGAGAGAGDWVGLDRFFSSMHVANVILVFEEELGDFWEEVDVVYLPIGWEIVYTFLD